MSRLRFNAVVQPTSPAAGKGEVYYDSALTPSPGRLAFVDENGLRSELSGYRSCHMTADDAGTTSTTLANQAALAFAVKNGVYYRFHFDVIWRTATGTTGLKVGLTTPTFTRYAANVKGVVAADATSALWSGSLTTSGDSSSLSGAEATGTDYVAEVEGIILPSADGTLQLQTAAEVGAAGTVTVRQGSCGQIWAL